MIKKDTCKGVNRLFLLIIFNMTVVPMFVVPLLRHMDIYDNTIFAVYLHIIPALLYAAVTRGKCLEDIPFKFPGIAVFLLVLLFTVLLLPVVAWINMISMMFSNNYIAQEMQTMETQNLLKNVFFLAVVPAVTEEYTVRGILYHGYRKAGILKGAIASGLIFGIIHLNINQFCYAAILGVIFALLIEATGSIFCSMLAHLTINLSSVLIVSAQAAAGRFTIPVAPAALRFPFLAMQNQLSYTGDEVVIIWLITTGVALVCAVLAYAVFGLITRLSHRREQIHAIFHESDGIPSDKKYRIITPSFIIAVVFGVSYMILIEWLL